MRVRELISELMKLDDLDAEVMVSTPIPYKFNEVWGPSELRLPTVKVKSGTFPGGRLEGVSWVNILATECWDIFIPEDGEPRLPRRPELQTPQGS